jgi:hypothetical protein
VQNRAWSEYHRARDGGTVLVVGREEATTKEEPVTRAIWPDGVPA